MVVSDGLDKESLDRAREDYGFYLKVTVDLRQKIVVIGGEYHADAEKLLLENHNSRQEDIWGGGVNLEDRRVEANALINLRPGVNESLEILDPEIRNQFLWLVEEKLNNLWNLL